MITWVLIEPSGNGTIYHRFEQGYYFDELPVSSRYLRFIQFLHMSNQKNRDMLGHTTFTYHSLSWWRGLCNSMKLWAMPCRATKTEGSHWRVLTKYGPLEEKMATHFSILSVRTPWTGWKGKKMIPEDESTILVDVHCATGEKQRNSSRKNEGAGLKQKWHSAVYESLGESKVQCCKEQYCIGTWNIRSMSQGKLDIVK